NRDTPSQLEAEVKAKCPDLEPAARDEALGVIRALFPNLRDSKAFYLNPFGSERAWEARVLAAYVYGDADAQGISQRRRKELWDTLSFLTPSGFNAQIGPDDREPTYAALMYWIDGL